MTTSIEWTDATWNPVTGCDKISPGCKHCYAEGIAERFFAKQYPANTDGSLRKFTDVRCHPERLEEPLHWKKPRRVFVNSMSDLFHEDVPEEFIRAVFTIMGNARQHTFQVLTKRPARMQEIIGKWKCDGLLLREGHGCVLPNVWLGVSVESQKYADERIPLLLATPAAIRFLSVEPQLEEIDITIPSTSFTEAEISWVICGGESGPGARPFNLAWAESLLKQCKEAGVPFFLKQLGAVPMEEESRWRGRNVMRLLNANNRTRVPEGFVPLKYSDRKGGDMEEWPEHLRVREFPR